MGKDPSRGKGNVKNIDHSSAGSILDHFKAARECEERFTREVHKYKETKSYSHLTKL